MSKIRRLFKSNKSSRAIERDVSSTGSPSIAIPQASLGLTVLAEGEDPIVDIVAVHGLNGDREETWTAENGKHWLRDLLPNDAPRARIFVWGYDAKTHSLEQVSQQYLHNHAERLLSDLNLERQQTNTHRRPIIFVAHSLGGIVLKETLILSDAAREGALPEHRAIKVSTHGIFFIGTPHQGGNGVVLGQLMVNIASVFVSADDRLLQHLARDSEWLQHQTTRYAKISKDFVTKFAFEVYKTPIKLGYLLMVVPRTSAVVPGASDAEAIALDADHRTMVRFSSPSDRNYKTISGHVKLMVANVEEEGRRRWAHEDRRNKEVSTNEPRTSSSLLIPPHNSHFVGRQEVLQDLQQRLTQHNVDRLALVGLGGVGKTQVAIQLAHWAAERLGWSVTWLSAVSAETLTQSCRQIVQELQLPRNDDEEDPRITLQRHYRSEQAGKWLLVVDNADDTAILHFDNVTGGFLPAHRNGKILFTTRHTEAAHELATAETIELSQMSLDDGLGLIKRTLKSARSPDPPDSKVMQDLLAALSFHPLAIAQAVAYMNTKHTTMAAYLNLIDNTEQDFVELLSRGINDRNDRTRESNAVATTWLVSFEQIRRTESNASNLLEFISRIQYKAIPLSLLPLTSLSMVARTSAIGTLQSYAFMMPRGDTETYDMHRLVPLAIRVWVSREEREQEVSLQAFEHMGEVFPVAQWENLGVRRAYLPHVLRAVQESQSQTQEARVWLCYLIGTSLREDGQYQASLPWLKEAVDWVQTRSTKDDKMRLLYEQALATVYHVNGQIPKAIELLEHVVKVKRSLPEEDPERLASQHMLASAYHTNGQLPEAIELLEHVVKVNRSLPGEHRNRLKSQSELAAAYLASGQLPEAIELLEHVVKVERSLPEEHSRRLASQHRLASAYIQNGQITEAIQLLQHVVNVYKKTLAEEHYSQLTSQHELARAYLANNQITEAIQLLEHIVNLREETLAEEHHNRLASQHALAQAYLANNQITEAIQLLEHVVNLREKTSAEEHHDRLASQHELAVADSGNGRLADATGLFEHVVAVASSTMRPNHSSLRIYQRNLREIRQIQNEANV